MHRRTASQQTFYSGVPEIQPASPRTLETPRTPRNQNLSTTTTALPTSPLLSFGSGASTLSHSLSLISGANLTQTSSNNTIEAALFKLSQANQTLAQMEEYWFGHSKHHTILQTQNAPNPILTAFKQTMADCATMNVTVLSGLTNLWQSLVLDYCSPYVQAFFNAQSNIVLTDDLKNTDNYATIIDNYTRLQNEVTNYQNSIKAYCKKNRLTPQIKAQINSQKTSYNQRFEAINQQLRQQNTLHKQRWQPSCKLTGNVLTAISYLFAQHSIHTPVLLPVACVLAIGVRFMAYCGDNIIKQNLSQAMVKKHDASVKNTLVRPESLNQLFAQHPKSFSNALPEVQMQKKLLQLITQQLQAIKQKSNYQNSPNWRELKSIEHFAKQANWQMIYSHHPEHLITKCLKSPWLLHIHHLLYQFQQVEFQINAIQGVTRDVPIILMQNIAQTIHGILSQYQDTLIDKDIMLVIEQLAKKVLNQIHDDGSIQQQQRLDVPRLLQKLLVEPLQIPFKAYENYKTATNMRNKLKQQLKDLEALTN